MILNLFQIQKNHTLKEKLKNNNWIHNKKINNMNNNNKITKNKKNSKINKMNIVKILNQLVSLSNLFNKKQNLKIKIVFKIKIIVLKIKNKLVKIIYNKTNILAKTFLIIIRMLKQMKLTQNNLIFIQKTLNQLVL